MFKHGNHSNGRLNIQNLNAEKQHSKIFLVLTQDLIRICFLHELGHS